MSADGQEHLPATSSNRAAAATHPQGRRGPWLGWPLAALLSLKSGEGAASQIHAPRVHHAVEKRLAGA